MSLDFSDKTERRLQGERRNTLWLEERIRSLDAETHPSEYQNGLRDAFYTVLVQANKNTSVKARVPVVQR